MPLQKIHVSINLKIFKIKIRFYSSIFQLTSRKCTHLCCNGEVIIFKMCFEVEMKISEMLNCEGTILKGRDVGGGGEIIMGVEWNLRVV